MYKELSISDLINNMSLDIEKYTEYDYIEKARVVSLRNIDFKFTGGQGFLDDFLEQANKFYNGFTKGKDNLASKIIFSNCKLNGINLPSDSTLKLHFEHCSFGDFKLGNIKQFDSEIIIKEKSYIDELILFNHNITGRFTIEDTTINNLQIVNCNFNGKFNFKRNLIIGSNFFNNTNFTEHADFHATTFDKAYDFEVHGAKTGEEAIFRKMTFSKMAIFENCVFKEECKFDYVTFESFANFRQSIFKAGLVLDTTNWSINPNFLSIKINKDSPSTTRETYRLIKSAFESTHNKIEANKFHALELFKYKCELSNKIPSWIPIATSLQCRKHENKIVFKMDGGDKLNHHIGFRKKEILSFDSAVLVHKSPWDTEKKHDKKSLKSILDWMVFSIQETSSEHSTNWLLPLYWMSIVSLVCAMLYNSSTNIIPSPIEWTIPLLLFIVLITFFIKKSMFKYISILMSFILLYYIHLGFVSEAFFHAFSPFDIEYRNKPMIFFFNKIIIGYLIYQFLLSIRKDTRK